MYSRQDEVVLTFGEAADRLGEIAAEDGHRDRRATRRVLRRSAGVGALVLGLGDGPAVAVSW